MIIVQIYGQNFVLESEMEFVIRNEVCHGD